MSFAALTLSEVWWAIGAAVLEFLWQGALIGALCALLLACSRGRSANTRYGVAFAALSVCLATFAVSFMRALGEVSAGALSAGLSSPLPSGSPVAEFVARSSATGAVAWCWSFGVLCMLLRFALQSHGVHRLKTAQVSEVDATWQRAFQSLKDELGVDRGVRLLRSGLAEVPMVVGWLSPVVLVPAAALAGLAPQELRALLAHELAHVRRHDHLFNAIQAVVETVLFFHPAVWWISKQVRLEREFCCDDSSIRLTGDRRVLAEALASMAALRLHSPQPNSVLAATGGPLMQRISRILGARPQARSTLTSWHLPAAFLLAGALAITGSAYASPVARDADVAHQGRSTKGADSPEQRVRQERVREFESADLRAEAAKIKAELDAGVAAGKLTRAQANERLAAWETRIVVRNEKHVEAERVLAKLDAMVKSGKITKAQAKERLVAWKQKSAQDSLVRADSARVKADLAAAVKAGKMTKAEAEQRLAEYVESMPKRRVRREAVDPAAVIKEIQIAVESGSITPAEGKAKIVAFRKALAERKAAENNNRNRELEEVKRRIESGVKSGEMTPEQGRARIDALLRELDKQAVKRKSSGVR